MVEFMEKLAKSVDSDELTVEEHNLHQLLTRMSLEPDVPHGASYPLLNTRKRVVAMRTVSLLSRTTIAR
jgi:hypothetical protein